MSDGQDMPGQVLTVLTAAAGRLLRARAMEAGAVAATFAGLTAAALEAAWSVARVQVFVAAVLCVLPVGLGAVAWLWRPLRRAAGLRPVEARPALAVCAAACAAGLICVLGGGHVLIPKALLPVILIPAGGLAGAAAVAMAGVSAMDAAAYHDARLGLQERLSTAAELAAGADRGPLAPCVYAQALEAARSELSRRPPVWRRTGATAGALGLAAALCAATALLPTWGLLDVERSFERIRDAAGGMTAERRADLLDALRRLEQQLRDNPRLAEALRAAVKAARNDLPDKLREELRRLEEASAGAGAAEAERIARALLQAVGLPEQEMDSSGGDVGGRQAGAKGVGPAERPDTNTILGDGTDRPLISRVYVYDKAYEALADANRPWPAAAAPIAAPGRPFVPLTDAWSAARDRAAAAMSAGGVPAEYRRLVRRFYELE